MLLSRNLSLAQRPSPALPACDALVEFFSHAKAASGVIRLLATRTKPLGYQRLMDEIRSVRTRPADQVPPAAIRAAIRITLSAGLVRMTDLGFSITDVGREVQSRIERSSAQQRLLPNL